MGEDAQEDFGVLRGIAAGAQGGSQPAFVPGEAAFDLPALVIDMDREASFHLAAINGRGPFPTAALVQGDNRGADA